MPGVCLCTKRAPFGFVGEDGETHWRCLEHRRFEVSDKMKLDAYQKNAIEKSLKPFAARATSLNILDENIRTMSKASVCRLIAAAVLSYEEELGKIFLNDGAHSEDIPKGQMNQACPECGCREWLDLGRSKKNKKLIGAGCKKCSRKVWLNESEAKHYGFI